MKNDHTKYKVTDNSIFPINLLLFSAKGFFFGVHTKQIKRIDSQVKSIDSYDVSTDLEIYEHLSSLNANLSPPDKQLIINTESCDEYFFPIHSVEDVITVEHRDIFPFPPIIEPFVIKKGLWAILPRSKRMYLLLDFKEPFLFSIKEKLNAKDKNHIK